MKTDYLRVSVTDRCNLRCVYCHPLGGCDFVERKEILRLEEIYRIVQLFAKCGIRKVRLEDLQLNKKLLLRAEMKLFGKAWMEFMIRQQGPRNVLSVTAYYQTSTVLGHLYWYLFLPFHHFIFANLIKQIEKKS